MSFYLNEIVKLNAKCFLQNAIKNIFIVLMISFSDVSIFFAVGLYLSHLQNVSTSATIIVCLFVLISLLFIGHRLFLSQIGSIYDSSILNKKQSIIEENEQNKLFFLVIESRKNAVINSVLALVNIAIASICLIFIQPIAFFIELCTMAVYIFFANKNIPKINHQCATYVNAISEAKVVGLQENDDEFNSGDNIVYQSAKLLESQSEVKALLKIISIVGWTVSCLIPIILNLTLSDYILTAIMLLYIVWQSFVISQTFDDVAISSYVIGQLQ